MPRSVIPGYGDKALPKKKKSAARRVAKTTRKKPVSEKAGARKVAKKTTKKAGKKATARRKPAVKKVPAKKKPAGKKAAAKKSMSKKKAQVKKVAGKKTAARKSPAKKRGSTTRHDALMAGPLHGFRTYKPRRGEKFMNGGQLTHFKNILTAWRQSLMEEVDRTVHHMKDEAANFPDPNDRATQESEFGLELRTRDRERKLIRKISQALTRIEDGTYGYCEETGDEIGLKRLEARPVATLCLEAQERREMAERQYRDRDDRYR